MKGVPLIFEKSKTGKEGFRLNTPEVPEIDLFQTLGEDIVRDEVDLPEVSELDVIRHYTQLSRMNFGVDNGFYPLGSCTMKYNPKINEEVAAMPGFTQLHPYAPEELSQGTLEIICHAKPPCPHHRYGLFYTTACCRCPRRTYRHTYHKKIFGTQRSKAHKNYRA